jgi:hypothetical protein
MLLHEANVLLHRLAVESFLLGNRLGTFRERFRQVAPGKIKAQTAGQQLAQVSLPLE